MHGYTRSSNKFCRFLGVGYRGKEFDLHSFPKNNLGYTVCWWIKLRPLDNIITHSMTKINYYLNLEIRYTYTATLYMVSGFREYIARLTIWSFSKALITYNFSTNVRVLHLAKMIEFSLNCVQNGLEVCILWEF